MEKFVEFYSFFSHELNKNYFVLNLLGGGNPLGKYCKIVGSFGYLFFKFLFFSFPSNLPQFSCHLQLQQMPEFADHSLVP